MNQEDRVGRNNARFRAANESIRDKADKARPPMSTIPFLCECPREDCRELVPMGIEDYANMREHPAYFVTVPGHESAEGAHVVVERTGKYLIVEKMGATRDIVVEDWDG